MSTMMEEMLKYNETFVAEKQYEKYHTSKYPDRNVAIVACMDTRLTELLPAALGIKNGDVKLIKNAGGVILLPFLQPELHPLIRLLKQLHQVSQEILFFHYLPAIYLQDYMHHRHISLFLNFVLSRQHYL